MNNFFEGVFDIGKNLYYTSSNNLAHHGILGQKWGKRNGPPYPLRAGDRSVAEKKAMARGSSKVAAARKSSASHSSSESNKNIDKYRQKMVSRYSKSDPNKAKAYKNASDEELQKEYQRRKDMEKAVLVGASAVGIATACYLAYRSSVIKQLSKNMTTDAAKQVFRESLDDMDYVIKEGSVMHRMVAFKNFDVSQTKGKFTYVTTTENDRLGYMAFLKDWNQTGERYDVTLEAVKKIVAPSDKKAQEIFQEIWDNDPTYQDELFNTLADGLRLRLKEAGQYVDDDTIREVVRKGIEENPFKSGIYSFVKGQSDSRKLADAYKAHGYSAIVDYFDKGSMGEQPMILFNASSDVVKKGEQFVTARMKFEAAKKIAKAKNHPLQKIAEQSVYY